MCVLTIRIIMSLLCRTIISLQNRMVRLGLRVREILNICEELNVDDRDVCDARTVHRFKLQE